MYGATSKLGTEPNTRCAAWKAKVHWATRAYRRSEHALDVPARKGTGRGDICIALDEGPTESWKPHLRSHRILVILMSNDAQDKPVSLTGAAAPGEEQVVVSDAQAVRPTDGYESSSDVELDEDDDE